MITRVAKAYMELYGILLLFLILWDQRAEGFLFSVSWLSGTLAPDTLGSEGGSGVSLGVGGREIAIIYCNALISQSLLYPI